MHYIGVCEPPEVNPIGVDLVVCDQDQTFRELGLQQSILRQLQLSLDTRVTADSAQSWSTPLCESCDDQSKALFRVGHVRVIIIFVDEV